MKNLVTVALVGMSVAVAAPAFAGRAKQHVANCRSVSAADQHCSRNQRTDRTDVYADDGRLIGRDPDPNIRRSLREEDAYYRNGRW